MLLKKKISLFIMYVGVVVWCVCAYVSIWHVCFTCWGHRLMLGSLSFFPSVPHSLKCFKMSLTGHQPPGNVPISLSLVFLHSAFLWVLGIRFQAIISGEANTSPTEPFPPIFLICSLVTAKIYRSVKIVV